MLGNWMLIVITPALQLSWPCLISSACWPCLTLAEFCSAVFFTDGHFIRIITVSSATFWPSPVVTSWSSRQRLRFRRVRPWSVELDQTISTVLCPVGLCREIAERSWTRIKAKHRSWHQHEGAIEPTIDSELLDNSSFQCPFPSFDLVIESCLCFSLLAAWSGSSIPSYQPISSCVPPHNSKTMLFLL